MSEFKGVTPSKAMEEEVDVSMRVNAPKFDGLQNILLSPVQGLFGFCKIGIQFLLGFLIEILFLLSLFLIELKKR